MRPDLAFVTSLLLSSAAAGTVDPAGQHASKRHVVRVDGEQPEPVARDPSVDHISESDLWKRRGGGGRGGRGGGGGGRSGGSRGGSGGSRGGSSGSNSRSNFPNTRGSSTAGGYSTMGTGPQPRFLGGSVYGGGARVPFSAGSRSPGGLRARGPLAGAALGFWPGLWIGGAYMYGPYSYHHHYHNSTSDEDEERPIICGCAEDSVCMCDEIDDDEFWEELIEDGDWEDFNKTLINVADVNGTETILINGTLPKGTTVESDDPEDWEEYFENAVAKSAQALGLWPAIGAVMGVALLT